MVARVKINSVLLVLLLITTVCSGQEQTSENSKTTKSKSQVQLATAITDDVAAKQNSFVGQFENAYQQLERKPVVPENLDSTYPLSQSDDNDFSIAGNPAQITAPTQLNLKNASAELGTGSGTSFDLQSLPELNTPPLPSTMSDSSPLIWWPVQVVSPLHPTNEVQSCLLYTSPSPRD